MGVESGFTQVPTWLAPKWIRSPIFRQVHVKSMFEPLGQTPVTADYNAGKADHWEAVITTIPLEWRDAQKLQSWGALVGLMGQAAVQDPLFLAPGSDGERPAQSNPQVDGAAQTGRSILCKNAGSAVLVIANGQHFQIGEQLFQATADATSDGPGAVTINFWPALRTSPADSATVDINNPFLHALLLNVPEVDIRKGTITPPISLGFKEKI